MSDNTPFICCETPVIKHLTEGFFSERKELFARIGNMRYAFKLCNPDNMTGNFMKINCVEYGKFLIIQGSLRKWYFAKQDIRDSFKDFTQPEFDDALKSLLSLLEIPYEMKKFFYVPSMEIGLTIPVKETCQVINRMICGFKSDWYKPTSPEEECKKYSSEDVAFNTYNKVLEISKHIKKKTYRESFLSSIGEQNYLRMELKVKGGKRAIEKRFNICNLEDFVNNYNQFYLYFFNEIENHLEVSPIYANEPIFDPKGKSPSEIMNYFKINGMYHLGEDYTNWIVRKSNDPREARRAIKRERKKLTFREGSYNKDSLLYDIREQLFRMIDRQEAWKKNEEKIPPKINKKRKLID